MIGNHSHLEIYVCEVCRCVTSLGLCCLDSRCTASTIRFPFNHDKAPFTLSFHFLHSISTVLKSAEYPSASIQVMCSFVNLKNYHLLNERYQNFKVAMGSSTLVNFLTRSRDRWLFTLPFLLWSIIAASFTCKHITYMADRLLLLLLSCSEYTWFKPSPTVRGTKPLWGKVELPQSSLMSSWFFGFSTGWKIRFIYWPQGATGWYLKEFPANVRRSNEYCKLYFACDGRSFYAWYEDSVMR